MPTFSEIINGEKPVLVDFYAEWCGPCKVMKPVLKELKITVGDGATILQVDVDKSPQTAGYYQIQGVPTLILFKKGKAVWRKSGAVSAGELEKILAAHNQ